MKTKARRVFHDDPRAHKLADHMQFCNRFCCRNPRRHKLWERRTWQEIKADEDWPEG